MKSTRALCGCAALRELETQPPPVTEGQRIMRESAEMDARENQRRWGCPAVSRVRIPLDRDLEGEARYVATVTGTPVADTCPLACVTYADPWVVELTRAVSLTEWHVPIENVVGRELTRADVMALSALKSAQGDAWKSNRQIEEQRRAAEQNRGRGGAR